LKSSADILGSVGGTPLVELKRIVPGGHSRVLVKLESHNPTGSMKDRLARSAIEIQSDRGRITGDLIHAVMRKAAGISKEPGAFYADQFNNTDASAGYAPLAEEVRDRSSGDEDVFVGASGAGADSSDSAVRFGTEVPVDRTLCVGHAGPLTGRLGRRRTA
jgi:cysteine synthase